MGHSSETAIDVLPATKGGIPVGETVIGSWRFTIQRIPFDAHEISRRYGKIAPRWEQKLRRLGFAEAYEKIFLHLISTGWLCGLTRQAKVLDCGLGTGSLSHALLRHYSPSAHLYGVDLSMAMLKTARSLLQSSAGLSVKRATLENLPYKSESFDMVMAAHVLEHLADPYPAIGEMMRVLKPGAPLLIVFTQKSWPSWCLQLRWRMHCWSQNTVEGLLRAHGISDIRYLPLAGSYWCRKLSLACIGRKRRRTF